MNRPIYKEFLRELLVKYEYFAKTYGNKVFYWLLTSIEKELDYKYKRASKVIDYLCDDLRIITTLPYNEARRINGKPLFDRRNSTKPRQKDDKTYFADTTKFYLFLWDRMVDDKFIEQITPQDAGKGDDIAEVRKMIKDFFIYLQTLPDKYEELKEQERQEQQEQQEKGQDQTDEPLQKRINDFYRDAKRIYNELVEDGEIYEDDEQFNIFILKWSEPTIDETKLAFELEKTFNLKWRLRMWFNHRGDFRR